MIVKRLLFICLCISFLSAYSSNIDKICITYGHIDGYAKFRSTAIYKPRGNFFVLRNKKKTHNSKYLPERFPRDIISDFLINITSPDVDTCSFYHISMKDFESYKDMVHEICSNEDYHDVILTSEINEEDYLLLCNHRLPELSCHDIMKALSTPCTLFPSEKPLMIITLFFSDRNCISITPSSCYEGQPWVVNDKHGKHYIDASKVMSTIQIINFERFLYLQERSLFVLHIANKIINNE